MRAWVLIARKSAIRFLPPEEEYFLFFNQRDAETAHDILRWTAPKLLSTSEIVEVDIETDPDVVALMGDEEAYVLHQWESGGKAAFIWEQSRKGRGG